MGMCQAFLFDNVYPMPDDAVLLDRVIAEVKAALDEYQSNLGAGDHALPPLSSAEFDCKTVTAPTEA